MRLATKSADARAGHEVALSISAGTRRAVRLGLTVAIVALAALGSACEVARVGFGRNFLLGFARLFGLGNEGNVPTWYASATLLLAGLLAGAAALLRHLARDRIARQWGFLALLLVLMSLDETASIHEWFPAIAADLLTRAEGRAWYVEYAWLAPGLLVVPLLVWWFAALWRSLRPEVRTKFTVAAAVFFGGAVGVELAEAVCAAALGVEAAGTSPIYSVIWTTQEILEMVGVAALLLALLDHLALERVVVTIRTGAGDDPAATR
jgi:hypothetical protein